MTTTSEVPVLIVGGGAAGSVLSMELARRGIEYRCIDRMPGPGPDTGIPAQEPGNSVAAGPSGPKSRSSQDSVPFEVRFVTEPTVREASDRSPCVTRARRRVRVENWI